MRGILRLAPWNANSPAGNAEIIVPRPVVREAGSSLFGERERTSSKFRRKRRSDPHQPLLARLSSTYGVTHSVEG